MKRVFAVLLLCGVCLAVSAQEVDRSQFTEIELFDFKVEENQKVEREYSVMYKMPVSFDMQSGTTIWFKDEAGDSKMFQTDRRWNLKRDERVMIYVTARHSSVFSLWLDVKLVDVEPIMSEAVKPWADYIQGEGSETRGWLLQRTGEGAYREVFVE